MTTKTLDRPAALTERERWAAVEARCDAPFVYAVTSTGVYCRPTCPSRRPRRDRVRFFETTAEARAAGFRACLRCRPDAGAAGPALDRVRAACDRLVADPTSGVARLAGGLGVTARQLQRDFAEVLGVSPADYAAAVKAAGFRRAVRHGGSLLDATFEAGYGSGSRLYERARLLLGMTPGAYARAGEAQRIRWHTTRALDGWLLLAATEQGICAVRLGADRAALVGALREEFRAATVEEAAADLAPWAGLVAAYLEGRARSVEVPLDVAATAFQARVWDALRRIPPGVTRTYGEIAASLGVPEAARAVGNACGANPAALAIPCHRAVGRGAVGGYRWGVERKQALLALEARR
jgi:AraC family transcriptional regulator of adaptative response/methylated-DNA-[protein]-cysteine methyltransferase